MLAVAALALAGCGGGATASGSRAKPRTSGGLTVSPGTARPTSTLKLRFRAPAATGRRGRTAYLYALGVRGPRRAGCVATRSAAVPVPRAGEMVSVRVGPAQLGGRWCVGSYTAQVQELARPVCSTGQMCPQFIRVVATIGPVTFRIER